MRVTASQLRKDIDRIFDFVLATGEPVEVEHRGRGLRIVPDDTPSRLARLVSRTDAVVGDSEELVHVDWPHEWRSSTRWRQAGGSEPRSTG